MKREEILDRVKNSLSRSKGNIKCLLGVVHLIRSGNNKVIICDKK
jgi:hypothetical protein